MLRLEACNELNSVRLALIWCSHVNVDVAREDSGNGLLVHSLRSRPYNVRLVPRG